jgi:DNA-binding transcriptional ArsR family regulator
MIRDVLAITKALSDETRLRALMLLEPGELCLCQLIELLELAPSTISKHLSVLHQAGLVEQRRAGRWRYYRWPQKPSPAVRRTLKMLHESLADEPRLQADRTRLNRVLKIDPAALCCNYNP